MTLLGNGSVEELARRSGLTDLDARRFRMLIEFSGGDPRIEDSWEGERLEVGDAVLQGRRTRQALRRHHPRPRHRDR